MWIHASSASFNVGRALQEESPHSVWLCLSNNNLEEFDDAYKWGYLHTESKRWIRTRHNDVRTNDTYIGQCVAAMRDAGLPVEAPVVAYGHSYGGIMVVNEVRVTRDSVKQIELERIPDQNNVHP